MKYCRESGFTLIELLLVFAVIGSLLTPLIYTYISGWNVWAFNRERVKFQQTHRLILTWVSKYARKANLINDNPTGDDLLRIRHPLDGSCDGIGYGINSDGYFYYRKRSGGSWGSVKTITDHKGKNMVCNYADGILNISMTLVSKDGKEYTFKDKIYPRFPDVTTP